MSIQSYVILYSQIGLQALPMSRWGVLRQFCLEGAGGDFTKNFDVLECQFCVD